MAESPERNGEALNWLLEGANDSANGFRQGASLARNPELHALFSDRAEQREQLAGQIADEVRSFAQTPSERGTVIGGAHQAFTSLRDAISQDSDKALVEELLRRERALANKFKSAVDDPLLPSRARDVAAGAVSDFTGAAEELAAINQRFETRAWHGSGPAAHFELSDEERQFLAAPSGAAVISTGAEGTQSVIQRAAETVVRIGIQSVAVVTAESGSLAVEIDTGGALAKGRDGPAPLERRLVASQTLDVLVKAGDALALRAAAAAENAQVLRTIVWSLDVAGPERDQDGPVTPVAEDDATQSAAAEAAGPATPT